MTTKKPTAPAPPIKRTFREFAQEVVRDRELTAQAKAVAVAENERLAQVLQGMADDLETRTGRMNPENLAEIADIQAREKQLELLRPKYAADAKKRLAEASKGMPVAAGIFIDFVRAELSAIENSLLPFCKGQESARRVAAETCSGKLLTRFIELERSFGGCSITDYYRAAECVAAGRPLHDW